MKMQFQAQFRGVSDTFSGNVQNKIFVTSILDDETTRNSPNRGQMNSESADELGCLVSPGSIFAEKCFDERSLGRDLKGLG